jgi:SAM-dependent methyltransferase
MPLDQYREANRANWDSRVDSHYGSDIYGISRFVDDSNFVGEVVSFDKEKMPDLAGRKLIHLQCHIGTDTIGLARLGADVTGIDFSEKSIEAANRLSDECGTPGRFLVSELYDASEKVPEKFDVVYTGVGAICWLPDIQGWAKVVASFLDEGGFFYMREGHPVMWSLDDERDDDELVIKYPYFSQSEPLRFVEETTYAGDGALSSPVIYDWNHGMAEVLQALIDAGLRIDQVEEYDALEWEAGAVNVLGDDGMFRLANGRERLPVMWSVLATKT